jgi:hypothetical protein
LSIDEEATPRSPLFLVDPIIETAIRLLEEPSPLEKRGDIVETATRPSSSARVD